MKHFIFRAVAYIIPTMALGMLWHFVLFEDLYHNLRIYNRAEPIIPLGFISMIVQGIIIAYLYPIYAKENINIKSSLRFSLIMGAFLFSVTTLANAAKIEVSSMQTWLLIQTAFHLIQFSIVGVFIGMIKPVLINKS